MKITVRYWRGTTRQEGIARTYRGAMRLAAKNQNAYSARFYDAQGKELYDDGQGLAYPDGDAQGRRVYAV